jgi:hypothetical protein
VHRYAPTSPSAFNHEKKPLLPGCDRHPSRSIARGAQQQPSPPHSGRGHSTAYTHRHFPLPSLVQDCSDDPLALAQGQTPHMPQYVSLKIPVREGSNSALLRTASIKRSGLRAFRSCGTQRQLGQSDLLHQEVTALLRRVGLLLLVCAAHMHAVAALVVASPPGEFRLLRARTNRRSSKQSRRAR